jgi:hypothetical protein
MLREHSQHSGRKLVDVAQAVVDSHLLLLPPTPATAEAVSGQPHEQGVQVPSRSRTRSRRSQ